MITGEVQTGSHSIIGSRILSQGEKEKIKLYRLIYQELILLFKRKKDLSGRSIATM